jgi:hypothetical protein
MNALFDLFDLYSVTLNEMELVQKSNSIFLINARIFKTHHDERSLCDFFFEGLGSVSCNGFIAIIKPVKGHIIICCEETLMALSWFFQL